MSDLKAQTCDGCDLSRRNFLQFLAAGAGVALLGGCGGDGGNAPRGEAPAAGSSANAIAASPVGKEFKVAGAGKLQNGQALSFVLPDQTRGIVLVTASGELRALSAKCTHAGGLVEWQGGKFHCPSHGSNFDATGKVLNGPADKPLPQYKARKSGDDALIALA